MSVDLQGLLETLDAWRPPPILPARAVETQPHAVYGSLVRAEVGEGSVWLLPLHVGTLRPTKPGDLGMAILGPGSNEGLWLHGRIASGLLGDWDGKAWRLRAVEEVLELQGDSGVNIQSGTAGAARTGDAVKVQITAADGPALLQLAAALLATGLFLPTPAPPPVPPIVVPAPIVFTGDITGGSASVKVGD